VKEYRRLERQHPIFSPVALVSTFILALGLGIGVYFTGGAAFSPGELSAVQHGEGTLQGAANHAELSGDCGRCHTPFVGIEAARCEACHENIARDRQAGLAQTAVASPNQPTNLLTGQPANQPPLGLHGRIPNAEECAACHLEHRGPDYDLKTTAVANFDHNLTRFTLAKHAVDYGERPLECTACHQETGTFAVSLSACAACHQEANQEFMARHRTAYGDNCLACHDGQDTLAAFTLADHAQVFALTGAHTAVACEDCHASGQFEGTPQDCAACHAEPQAHSGMFGTACADCHTPEEWKPAIINGLPFDHNLDTSFSLSKHEANFDGRPFTCTTCHANQNPADFKQAQCLDCHQTAEPTFMADHTAQFGPNCQSCHDGTGNMTNFDHSLIWPLEGQHAVANCTNCHAEQIFKGTPRECAACHTEPTIHAGLFGTECAACHTAVAWQPARLRQHTFPLDHGEQGQLDCTACHTATYAEYTCTNCHEHETNEMRDEHDDVDFSQIDFFACAECHPTGQEQDHTD